MSPFFYTRIVSRPLLQRTLAARTFTTTALRTADEPTTSPPTVTPTLKATASSSMSPLVTDLFSRGSSTSSASGSATPVGASGSMRSISNSLFGGATPGVSANVIDPNQAPLTDKEIEEDDSVEPYHFHIFSHKHNTHITVTRPNRKPIVSMSCGNIGIRKARRKNYDAAYQLTAYVLERLYHQGWQHKINNLEIVLKGFGQGREAATKVLLGTEGKLLTDKIRRVSDDTKIKFGGTRSKNPRRI